MKVSIYSILFLVFLMRCCPIDAQNIDLGFSGGVSYYVGEINPSTQVLNQPMPSVGIFYRKNINKRYALRHGVNYAKLSAAEETRSTALSEYRQLSFSSDLWEAYSMLEFNFLPYKINDKSTSPFSPYVFIGLAIFRVNPTASGRLFSDVESSMISVSIPFGLGLKFHFAGNLGLGIEWGMRKTYTDNIDGLPSQYENGYQLSNTQNNDWYSILGVTLNYKFLTDKDKCNMPRF